MTDQTPAARAGETDAYAESASPHASASPVPPSPRSDPSPASPLPASGSAPSPAGATPPVPGVPATSGQAGDDDSDELTVPSGGLWQRMKADPQYAPEHLALEAVRRLGPAAAAWAEQARATYPGIQPDALAQQAIKRFTTHARISGAVSGAAGLPGAVVDVGVLAWTQARMVLHVAAAYNVDPTHPDRATDLLVLQRVHKAAETARLALGVAAGRERAATLFTRMASAPMSRVMLQLGLRLARMAGIRAARRIFAKIIPGASIILGTWANSSATTGLAGRATAHYRQTAQRALPQQQHQPLG